MRKILLIAATSLFLAATVKAQKEKSETIEGNGRTVTKEIPVSSFESLKASGVYELKLSQGNAESVKIEADENLQQYFTVRTEGKQLVIDMKEVKNKNMKLKNKLKVYVTFKELKEMDLSMVGNVQTDALKFSDLEINNNSVGHVDLNLSANTVSVKNNSVGQMKLAGKAQNAVVKHNGVGSLQAGDFVVQTMNIDNSGVGGAEVNASKELKVSDNMLGKVKNKGTAPVKKNNKVVI
ncbi:MAG: DUF2807 domain-containing protein [Chitinophagaceae bacterium]|nr:MAG: DUF2807 domain-containing protein [Chitinophagaceae bacterium]